MIDFVLKMIDFALKMVSSALTRGVSQGPLGAVRELEQVSAGKAQQTNLEGHVAAAARVLLPGSCDWIRLIFRCHSMS